MRDARGRVLAGIEVKAGTDPAGALERLGAVFKSFDRILEESPEAETILVLSCITDEVQSRVDASATIKRKFNLVEILSNKNQIQTQFVNHLRGLLGLSRRTR